MFLHPQLLLLLQTRLPLDFELDTLKTCMLGYLEFWMVPFQTLQPKRKVGRMAVLSSEVHHYWGRMLKGFQCLQDWDSKVESMVHSIVKRIHDDSHQYLIAHIALLPHTFAA